MPKKETEHSGEYTHAWQVYDDFIVPGATVVSVGPYRLESDPTLAVAARLLYGTGTLYIADPRSFQHPIDDVSKVERIVGPIEEAGDVDAYIRQLRELEEAFGIAFASPVWLGVENGLFHIELPFGDSADVIIDRGTSGYVFAEKPIYTLPELYVQAFRADRAALRTGGSLILQTNLRRYGFRTRDFELLRFDMKELLFEAGFSQVRQFRVKEEHRLYVSAESAIAIDLAANETGIFTGLHGELWKLLRTDVNGERYLEFSQATRVGIHSVVNNDIFIARK